jgi:uncharacterized protein
MYRDAMSDQSLGTLRAIYRYPIKGLRGEELPSAQLAAGQGLPGDRALALRFRDASPGEPDPARHAWLAKTLLAVQAEWPALGALSAQLDAAGTLTVDGRDRYQLTPGSPDRERFARRMTAYLKSAASVPGAGKHPQATELELLGTPGGSTSYADRARYHVSVLSLATLRELAGRLGRDFTIHRFRGNLIVDGGDAWAEHALVGRRFRVGGAVLELMAPIGRCNNINVSQDTGQMDHPVLDGLKASYGHAKFGAMANVIEGGLIRPGDAWVPA